MCNQANIRLHVDLFIKYVSSNGQFYIDITNNWQRKLLIKLKSLYIFLTFLAPPAERQRSFSNTDLSVVRLSVRPSVCLSVKIEGGEGSISETLQ